MELKRVHNKQVDDSIIDKHFLITIQYRIAFVKQVEVRNLKIMHRICIKTSEHHQYRTCSEKHEWESPMLTIAFEEFFHHA